MKKHDLGALIIPNGLIVSNADQPTTIMGENYKLITLLQITA